MPCTASWQLLLLRRCICPVSAQWYLQLLSWSHHWTQAWPFKLGVWPTPTEKVAEVAVRGMQRPRDLQQSQNDFFSFEQVQDGLGAMSSCTILMTCSNWLDQWQMNWFQLDPIMSRSLKVSVTSMLTCPLLPPSISQPAPFYQWAKPTHVITMLFPRLKYASLFSGHYGTQEMSYL